MTNQEIKEKVREKIEQGWIDVWFVFEVMAITKEAAEEALKKHIEKLEKLKTIIAYEKEFREVRKVENPPLNVKEAWSQIVEVKAAVKSFFDLINITILYGPSAIEIHSPKEIRIKIDEAQNIVNIIAGLVHQFAAAKVGGIVIRK